MSPRRTRSVERWRKADASAAPIAVLDIGSNSGRVVVYAREGAGHLRLVAGSRASLRLVEDLDETGRLGTAALARVREALGDFAALATGAGAARPVALATAAVREARDGAAFLARLRRDTGIEVRVVDGAEEARYGFLGAVRGLPVESGVLFDMGGGSLQLSRFRNRRLVGSVSLPLGALRLSHEFLVSDPPRATEIRRLERHARAALAEAGLAPLMPDERLVGTGGTLRNLAKLDRRRRSYPISRLHGYVLERSRLDEVVDLVAGRRLRKRAALAGLSRDRADSIAGGALGIRALVESLVAGEVLVSGQGVREGVAYERLGARLPPIDRVRASSLAALGKRFGSWQEARARRRRALATALQRGLAPRLEDELVAALHSAALLLDVGGAVDFFDRREHTADILLATDLDGFTHREVALVSALVRASSDSERDWPRYAPLVRRRDVPALERAGALLALADDLEERCPPGVVLEPRCRLAGRRAEVVLPALAGWRERGLGERFAAAFGRRLSVRAR
jgi:exopolyphosphatase/guanosine-5'-triphosphate,3'-diphosphate pyrophosphatase